jgi:hypothetical protein
MGELAFWGCGHEPSLLTCAVSGIVPPKSVQALHGSWLTPSAMMIAAADHSDPIISSIVESHSDSKIRRARVGDISVAGAGTNSEADFGVADHYFSARVQFRLGHVIRVGACRATSPFCRRPACYRCCCLWRPVLQKPCLFDMQIQIMVWDRYVNMGPFDPM